MKSAAEPPSYAAKKKVSSIYLRSRAPVLFSASLFRSAKNSSR